MTIPNEVLIPVNAAIADLASSRTLPGAVKAIQMGAKHIHTNTDLMPTDLRVAKRVLFSQGGAAGLVVGVAAAIGVYVYLEKSGRLASREEAATRKANAALASGAKTVDRDEDFSDLEQAVVRVEERFDALRRVARPTGDEWSTELSRPAGTPPTQSR